MSSVKDATGAEARALAELADFTGKRVLEVGCGDGRLTWLYAHDAREVLGVDSDGDAIEEARAALLAELADRVSFRVAEAEALDVPPPRFDIAFLSWSL
ncbi:MAG: class I SAM-dependent methyltransferase [Gaiellaceae bacterium]